MLDSYIDPYDVLRLCEMPDCDGHNVFWYLDNFDLYEVLNCRILDRILMNKWSGKHDTNASLFDYSTGFVMMEDRYGIFENSRVF